MRAMRWVVLGGTALLLGALSLPAQVIREDGVKSVAGTLGGVEARAYAEYSLSSSGGEILFASIDAMTYQSSGRNAEEHATGLITPLAGEGEDGACTDEGGDQLCLQVIDSTGEVLCWAERPNYPGWQRDPRLVCILPTVSSKPETYFLRVALADQSCADLVYPEAPQDRLIPYLLNVSLRRIAPQGPLATAVALSKSRL